MAKKIAKNSDALDHGLDHVDAVSVVRRHMGRAQSRKGFGWVALGDLSDIAVNEEIHRKVSTNERSRPPLSREYRLKQLVADISGYIC
jgi:hypothetical protein